MGKKNKEKASEGGPVEATPTPAAAAPAPQKPVAPKEVPQKPAEAPKPVPKTTTNPAPAAKPAENVGGGESGEGTLKKRRRRRRKPAAPGAEGQPKPATPENTEKAKKKRKRNKTRTIINENGEKIVVKKGPKKPKKKKTPVEETKAATTTNAEAELTKLAASVDQIAKQLDDKKQTTEVKVEKPVEQKPQEKAQKERKVSEKSPKEEKAAPQKPQQEKKERKVSEKSEPAPQKAQEKPVEQKVVEKVEQKPQEKQQKERKVSEKKEEKLAPQKPQEKPAEKPQEKPQEKKERKVSEKSSPPKSQEKPVEQKTQEKQQKERKVSEKSQKNEQPKKEDAPKKQDAKPQQAPKENNQKPAEAKPQVCPFKAAEAEKLKTEAKVEAPKPVQKEETKPQPQKTPEVAKKVEEKKQEAPKPVEKKPEPPKPVEKPAEKKPEPPKPVEKPAEKKPEPPKPVEKPVEKKPEPPKPVEKPAEKKPEPPKPVEKPVEKQPEPQKPVEKPAEKKPEPPKPVEKPAEKKPEPPKPVEKPVEVKPEPPKAETKPVEQKKSPPKETKKEEPKPQAPKEQKKSPPKEQAKPKVEQKVEPPKSAPAEPPKPEAPKDNSKAVAVAPKKDVVPVPPKEIVPVPPKEIVAVTNNEIVRLPGSQKFEVVAQVDGKPQPTVAKVAETKVEASKEKPVADKALLADALKDVKPVEKNNNVQTNDDNKSTGSADSKKSETNGKVDNNNKKQKNEAAPKNEGGSDFAPSANNNGAKSLAKEKSPAPNTTSDKLIENLDVKVTTPNNNNKKPQVPPKSPNVAAKAAQKGKPENLQRTVSSPASSPARAPPKVQTQKSVSPSKVGNARSSPPKTVPVDVKLQQQEKAPQVAGSPKKAAAAPAQNKPKIAPKPENVKPKSPPKGAVPKTAAAPKSPQKTGPGATPAATSNSRPEENKGINKLLDAFTELLKNRANNNKSNDSNNNLTNSNDINKKSSASSSASSPPSSQSPANAQSPSASPKPKQKQPAPPSQPKVEVAAPISEKGPGKTKDIHNILRKAFAHNETPIPKKVTPEFDLSAFLTDDQLKTILNKMENPEAMPDSLAIDEVTELGGKPSQLMNSLDLLKSLARPPLDKREVAAGSDESDEDFDLEDEDEEGEEYVEFKYAPRPIFMASICQHCKNILRESVSCKRCHLVYYCKDEHLVADEANHKPLCVEIEKIAKTRGPHLYSFAQKLTFDDFRSLRVYTLHMCEQALGRQLQPYEREIMLFPRLCSDPICREWRPDLLTVCKECRHVSYCEAKPSHLPDSHKKWCAFYTLYYKLLLRQKLNGRIEPILPNRILQKPTQIPETMDEVFKMLFKNSTALKDDCTYATMTQIATVPLTALYAYQLSEQALPEVFTIHLIALKDDCIFATMTQIATIPLTALGAYQRCGKPVGEVFTMHLVGAELQFEGDTLDKFETFMLHLMPEVNELRIVFVGSELNTENLPLDIISRIRPCRKCRKDCRAVKFEFHCKTLYNEYCSSASYSKPDIICFFNPTFFHSKGSHYDKWAYTIRAAVEQKCPVVVTSYTEYESPLDLDVFLGDSKDVDYNFEIVQTPARNPYGSRKPERNFVSEEVASMVFKNFWWFIVK